MPKKTVEDSLRVDMAAEKKRGLLTLDKGDILQIRQTGITGSVTLELIRNPRGKPTFRVQVLGRSDRPLPPQTIRTKTSKANFGGERLWLECPNCKSRRRVLFVPPGATRLGCRQCHGLTYRDRLRRRDVPHEILRAIERISEAEDVLLFGINSTPDGRKKLLAGIQAMHFVKEYISGIASG